MVVTFCVHSQGIQDHGLLTKDINPWQSRLLCRQGEGPHDGVVAQLYACLDDPVAYMTTEWYEVLYPLIAGYGQRSKQRAITAGGDPSPVIIQFTKVEVER